ncbi:hypothetical protein LCGC14_2030200, partial [marine sediment metagenome]
MSETRFNEKNDSWEVVVKTNFSASAMSAFESEFGVDAKKELVAS